jgi:hypothetical protein
MTNEQAKEILKLYRPGTADADDPSFAEALELSECDGDLKKWFAEHCALYAALRAKFKEIAVPEGLREQIIAERRVHVTPMWQKAVVLMGAVAAVIMLVFELGLWPQPSEPHDFKAYRSYMVSSAIRAYGMDTNTADLDQIRMFFAQKKAIADYVLPSGLQKNAEAAGCVAATWQGKQVSMICFKTGRPLARGDQSDLWLFITDSATAKDTPKATTPKFEKVNGLDVITANWTAGGRTYVLATKGDEQFLSKFL